MKPLMPNWEEISTILIVKLDEIADQLQWAIECGADPASAVLEATEELKIYVQAVESDPGQLCSENVS